MGWGRLRAYFLAFCSFAPRRPGRNFSNLKFPSGPTFALQLHPRTGGVFIALDNVALAAAAARRARRGGRRGGRRGKRLLVQPPLFPPARISAFVNTHVLSAFFFRSPFRRASLLSTGKPPLLPLPSAPNLLQTTVSTQPAIN